MSDNLPIETVSPALSGPDAPKFPPISPGLLVDLALIESLNLTDAQERAASAERAAAVIADAEARAAKLIAAAVADAEEQVADVRPLAEAAAEKIIQEAKDEAASILADAEKATEKLHADAESALAKARDQAAEITADAEAEAADRLKALEVDRQLVREKVEESEARETAAAKMTEEAATLLREAKAEAERLTTEAGETVDRMMRSGQVVAEAQREAYTSDVEGLSALQAQHATALRDLTDRYEAKVSNQNIENLELRQEIADLRDSMAAIVTNTPTPSEEDAPETPPSEEIPTDDAEDSNSHTDDFASQWMIPEDPESETSPDIDFDESPDPDDPDLTQTVGPATGLAPNARLVEPLQASVFRPSDDSSKKRRRKKR